MLPGKAQQQLAMFVIYMNPSDHPGTKIVIKKWLIGFGIATATDEVMKFGSLDEAREM
jgi:hypothetical protein